MSVHTIPVPHGWSVEQAWEHLSRGHLFTPAEQEQADMASIEVIGLRTVPHPNGERVVGGALKKVLP